MTPGASTTGRPGHLLQFPWGRAGILSLTLPAPWPRPVVHEPDLSGVLDPSAYAPCLHAALDRLPAGQRLEDLASRARRVAIVVDDPSRWTPVRDALPLLLGRLKACGLRDDQIEICFGVGRHQAVSDAAMRARLGEEVVEAHACHSPPLDDRSAYDTLGTTSQGVPVRIFQPVARADLRILVGSVLPHLQAGFGGGWKLILPGCSHRSTLGALHRQGIGGNEVHTLLGSSPEANPMRRAIREAAALLGGTTLSISHLLGAPGQLLQIEAGAPDVVQSLLSAEARRRFEAPPGGAQADCLIVGNHPWPGDPMQSFKVLLHHRHACRPGGTLVGLFWTDEAEIDRSFPRWAAQAIGATGGAGAWLIQRGVGWADRMASRFESSAAFMLHWARELVLDRHVLVYAPPLARAVGPHLGPVRLIDDLDRLPHHIQSLQPGHNPPTIRAFPHGGLTYCPNDRLPL